MSTLKRLPASTATPQFAAAITIPPLSTTPRPWLCLRTQSALLVAEQIQRSTLVQQPVMMWLRPVLLHQEGAVMDLSQSPDILWPEVDCSPAYAEEVLPLLTVLQQQSVVDGRPLPPPSLVQAFLQTLWQETH